MERGLICILNNYIDLLDRLILISSTVNRKHQVRCLSFNVEAISCNTQLEFQHTGIISVNAFELTSGTCNKLVPAYIYIYIFFLRSCLDTDGRRNHETRVTVRRDSNYKSVSNGTAWNCRFRYHENYIRPLPTEYQMNKRKPR